MQHHPFALFARPRRACFAILLLAFALAGHGVASVANTLPPPIKIAIFEFELDDRSAGGGIIPEDDIDRPSLVQSTNEAKRLLLATGRYSIVDTSSVAAEVKAANGIINCNACEVALARKLGADQALVGVVPRVSRTEYTLFMRVKDARTGAEIASGFTGLRLGANYAWARGVTWLMNNQILPKLGSAPRKN